MIVRERPPAGEPAGALVLLHGRGADEHDLFPLLDVLDPSQRLHGYCPRAPLRVEHVEQREEVVLVGAAPVEEHERAGGLALSRPFACDEHEGSAKA